MPSLFDADAFDLTEEAPAKINLGLHVTGQRADGYHQLEMLVTFARHGDRLGLRRAEQDGFELSGRFGPLLGGQTQSPDNLIVRSRDLLRRAARDMGVAAPPVTIHLQKNLPIAAGIGGGSADAAAALRGLMRIWHLQLPQDRLMAIALQLGADVPMCLFSRPMIARGIGEDIEALPAFPAFAMLLGNPLVGVSTPGVFGELANKNNPAFALAATPPVSPADWIAAIGRLRNDLEPPARKLCAAIGELSDMLLRQKPRLVRMSGSGATCFAIFDDMAAAEAAAKALHRMKPGWYFQATETIAGDL